MRAANTNRRPSEQPDRENGRANDKQTAPTDRAHCVPAQNIYFGNTPPHNIHPFWAICSAVGGKMRIHKTLARHVWGFAFLGTEIILDDGGGK